MRESQTNTEIKKSLVVGGGWAHKIADFPQSMLRGSRFNPEKPCDIVGGYHGVFYGIEGKLIKKFESFGLKNMRPSQVKNLTEMVAKGNRAFVFLVIRISPNRATGVRRINRLLIFDWAKWHGTWERLGNLKKKHLEGAKGIEGKNGLFDLKDFLDGLERTHNKRT